jgi:hypothetical protein
LLTIIVIGAVASLAMFAILLKLSDADPKRAEKTEKGEIIKQLLALSELENRNSASARPARPPAARRVQPPAARQVQPPAARQEKPSPPAESSQPEQTENASECVGL